MDEKELAAAAIEARKMAYTPYSGFQVGAALLTKSGRVYQGCNIENAAYTPSNCAERTAFFKAVSEGEREFAAIAIVGGKAGQDITDFCPPCGVCRQVMMEFCDPDEFKVILAKSPEERKTLSLHELLPLGFSGRNLEEGGKSL
ncbi:cytidine deaminase [Caproicibacter sp.]|uniref:cytidine deaminase n=1 Tax=Caproicibacter sp. TaxID=2814884 RepID=UPI003988BEBB